MDIVAGFLLAVWINNEAYAKNLGEKATQVLFKNYWGSLDADGHVLTIPWYQGTVGSDCFKSHRNSKCFDFFQEKIWQLAVWNLSCATTTSFLLQNLSALEKNIFRRDSFWGSLIVWNLWRVRIKNCMLQCGLCQNKYVYVFWLKIPHDFPI